MRPERSREAIRCMAEALQEGPLGEDTMVAALDYGRSRRVSQIEIEEVAEMSVRDALKWPYDPVEVAA